MAAPPNHELEAAAGFPAGTSTGASGDTLVHGPFTVAAAFAAGTAVSVIMPFQLVMRCVLVTGTISVMGEWDISPGLTSMDLEFGQFAF